MALNDNVIIIEVQRSVRYSPCRTRRPRNRDDRDQPMPDPVSLCLALLCAWGVIGVAGLVRPGSVFVVGRVLFPTGLVLGVAGGGMLLFWPRESHEVVVGWRMQF